MEKMRFVSVFHNHQPVGNDPRIIAEVAEASYPPLLAAIPSSDRIAQVLALSDRIEPGSAYGPRASG